MRQGYLNQVKLLLRILPEVEKIQNFAIKGGTAINFFLRDIPRLSVDIDLTYVPINDRESSLIDISQSLTTIASRIKRRIPGIQIRDKKLRSGHTVTLFINTKEALVKVEVNTILRGTIFPPEEKEVNHGLRNILGINEFVIARTISVPELYAGKMIATLDRQHPRDLFDIKILYDNEGMADSIRRTFLIYLVSSSRPIAEILNPNLLHIDS
ncbi:MAG: nucleotidyl transferase AbiEii/AbiGii toxin family protein, partial [bacterium]